MFPTFGGEPNLASAKSVERELIALNVFLISYFSLEALCGNEEVCNEEGLCVCAPGFCDSDGLSTGAIVAIAILVPLGVVLIVGGGGAYLFYRKYGLDRSYAFRRRGE